LDGNSLAPTLRAIYLTVNGLDHYGAHESNAGGKMAFAAKSTGVPGRALLAPRANKAADDGLRAPGADDLMGWEGQDQAGALEMPQNPGYW
jgi:hypothetical protein